MRKMWLLPLVFGILIGCAKTVRTAGPQDFHENWAIAYMPSNQVVVWVRNSEGEKAAKDFLCKKYICAWQEHGRAYIVERTEK